MSWIKELAKAGLSELSPRQAARHALTKPMLELPDPLAPLVKEMNVSTLYSTGINIERVKI